MASISSERLRLGIIGCGRPRKAAGATGFGMAHAHMRGYAADGGVQLVALADVSLDNARTFQAEHGGESLYNDYQQMLACEKLDVVSICTWPALHAPMVLAAAEAGVKAIHCEKPMALTFGDARRMVQTCADRGVQLTFNHQRRFLPVFRKARELLRDGVIGPLQRLEAMTGDLFDWGTHWFDMLFFYNEQTPAEWVMGQIDLRGHKTLFGAPLEGQGLAHFKYRNGVRGILITGADPGWGAQNRLVGADGVVEVGVSGGPDLRFWKKGQADWVTVDVPEGLHGGDAHARGIADLLDALRRGCEPELSGRFALQATEMIFATYESARRGGRIDLPLEIEDSPLADLLQRHESELAVPV